jgi:hypothetical protein
VNWASTRRKPRLSSGSGEVSTPEERTGSPGLRLEYAGMAWMTVEAAVAIAAASAFCISKLTFRYSPRIAGACRTFASAAIVSLLNA